MNIIIEIATEEAEWIKYPDLNIDFFAEKVEKILSRYPNLQKVQNIELSILLTNNNKITSLNKEFRNKDKPTNVLSFPDTEIDWRKILEFSPNEDYMYLGDIAFAYGVIKDEASSKSISFQDHLNHLAVHSILHLIGYDHMNEEEANVMETLEIEILSTFGIDSPYKQKM